MILGRFPLSIFCSRGLTRADAPVDVMTENLLSQQTLSLCHFYRGKDFLKVAWVVEVAVHLEHRHPVGNRVILVLHLLVGIDIIACFNVNVTSLSNFVQS